MDDRALLSRQFEVRRPRLRALAARILGSSAEADDVLQETWLRLDRSNVGVINDLDAWLTTVTSRLCLDLLRSPRRAREQPWRVETWDAEPADATTEPHVRAIQNDHVTAALLVVLDTLGPTERLTFVLHDVFGLSFAEIGEVIDKSPEAARQIASRARRRLRELPAAPAPTSRRRSGDVIDAWLRAVQAGNFEALIELLDEGAVLDADYGATSETIHGARSIAEQALFAARVAAHSQPVWIGGRPGVAAVLDGTVVSLMAFDIIAGRITGLDVLADPNRIAALGVAELLARES
jgi:RNA polymerase sigma-70 factor (ECF subfamily)